MSEPKSVVKIEDWSVVGSQDPYLPPECRTTSLHGRVYGHHRKEDGSLVRTSAIKSVKGRTITTDSGTVYRLGRVSKTYLQWLKDNGLKYNCCNPIVDRTKEGAK